MARSDVCLAVVGALHYTKLDGMQQKSALGAKIDELQTYIAAGTTDTGTSSATAKTAINTYIVAALTMQPTSAIDQTLRTANAVAQAVS